MCAIAFGSVANVSQQAWKVRRAGLKRTWVDYFISLIIACFAGYFLAELARWLGVSDDSLPLFGAAGAFLGSSGLKAASESLLENLIRKKTNGTEKND